MNCSSQPKNTGRARQTAWRLIFWSLFLVLLMLFGAGMAHLLGGLILAGAGCLIALWVLFSLYCLLFFRDPRIRPPTDPNLLLAPACGKADWVGETEQGPPSPGPWKRVSIFMSVFDVHVQYAPCRARVVETKYRPGAFGNALRLESADLNEQLWIGLEPLDHPGERIWVRLIAGLIARRIECWVQIGEEVAPGDRIGMIRLGSRVELFFPPSWELTVAQGARVRGGVTIVAQKSKDHAKEQSKQ